jgi:hypothetical protein
MREEKILFLLLLFVVVVCNDYSKNKNQSKFFIEKNFSTNEAISGDDRT